MTASPPLPRVDLTGQRILFFCPRFFSYENDIADELRGRGAEVDLLLDRPFRSPLFHLAARVWRHAVLPVTDRYYRRRLAKGAAAYDHVFVVNGQTVSHKLLAQLKRDNAAARFTLYMWDSLANRRGALALRPLFDRAFSFEPSAADHGFRLRPLFFGAAYQQGQDEETRYAISFVGTAHTDRFPVAMRVDRSLPTHVSRFWYFYLKAPWVLAAMRASDPALRGASADKFRFEPLSRAESTRIFWQSRAILDIEHPRQEGLTMRTFEALGAGKKLVTTNRHVARYALFDPAVIRVVDRADPKMPAEFLESDAPPLPSEFAERYSLAGWIDEIFSDTPGENVHLRSPEGVAA